MEDTPNGMPELSVYCASRRARLTYDVACVDIDNAPPAMRWYSRPCADRISRDVDFTVAQLQARARSTAVAASSRLLMRFWLLAVELFSLGALLLALGYAELVALAYPLPVVLHAVAEPL